MKLAKLRRELENMFDQMAEDAIKTLALIVKADAQGSYEASHRRSQAVDGEVKFNIVHAGGAASPVGRQPGTRVEGR